MRLKKSLKDLSRCKRGNVMIMVAATTPLLIGASAVGLDTIQLTLAKRELQRAADSAAMAGALARSQLGTTASATAAAEQDLTYNNRAPLITRTIENRPTSGSYATDNNAVRVILKTKRDVPFISFFTGEDIDVEVEATATALPDGNYCVISLENTATTGITFSGTADVNLGCGVVSNSTGTSAISMNGGPTVTASPIAARGGVPAATSFQGTTVVIPNAPLQADPYASLPNPTVPANCAPGVDVQPNETQTISPGCYNGMDLKGTVTLNPGTYIINGGTLNFGSQANVTGNGVTFVLTSSTAASNPSSIASLSMNGGAQIRLNAPETGEYADLLIYQDRRAPNQTPHINGGANSWIDGAIYMPRQAVTFNGNAGFDVRCMRLVTLRVTFSGNADITNNCDLNDPDRGYTGIVVRLVS